MTLTTALITNPGDLDDLGAELAAAPAIGLDTEFMRERTYRAELCLLQTATPSRATCVDPLALGALAPLATALGTGARQDPARRTPGPRGAVGRGRARRAGF